MAEFNAENCDLHTTPLTPVSPDFDNSLKIHEFYCKELGKNIMGEVVQEGFKRCVTCLADCKHKAK